MRNNLHSYKAIYILIITFTKTLRKSNTLYSIDFIFNRLHCYKFQLRFTTNKWIFRFMKARVLEQC